MSRPAPLASGEHRALAGEIERVAASDPCDVGRLCELGATALQLGLHDLAATAFRHATTLLRRVAADGRVNAALTVEAAIYNAFVRSVENELHYENCFGQWREAMAQMGRRLQAPGLPHARKDGGIGFVLHHGIVLGHTEVLFRLLENRPESTPPVRLYSLVGASDEFLRRSSDLGIAVESPPPGDGQAAIGWLRDRLRANGDTCAIWVSSPAIASTLLAARVAPVQIFWSLRYHPIRLPEIDGYITYGSWSERERIFHGQRWTVCPVPLALRPASVDPADVARLRAQFPEKILLGTLAREEKINSRPFLESVAEILRRHPDAGWLWTGSAEHAGIAAFMRGRGLADRCHFVGWVHTPLYAAALDVFLETFPLGCGITGYQALGAGVPLVSFLDFNTVFGMQYWSEVLEKAGSREAVTRELLEAYPVACAREPGEYVQIASRLITDEAYRDGWKAREARFYETEIRDIARYSRRYFDTVRDIVARVAR